MDLYIRCKVRYQKSGNDWRCDVSYPLAELQFFAYGKTKSEAFSTALLVMKEHGIVTKTDLKIVRAPDRLRRRRVVRSAK